MRTAAKFKMAIDLCMTIGILLSMSYLLVGEAVHEWNGAALLVLFLLHNVLNRKWYGGLLRGKYTAARVFRTAVNLLVLLSMIGSMASGIILSRHVFGFVSVSGFTAFARTLHMLAAYWGFALTSMHLGLHWSMILGNMKKAAGQNIPTRPFLWGLRTGAALIALYGAYAFIRHNLAAYMFLRVQFVFFDFERPLALFFIDYAAMMALWALTAHYIQMFLKRQRMQRRD
jgi:hypothetical protein